MASKRTKPKPLGPWDRRLWGASFTTGMDEPSLLLGTAWHDNAMVPSRYDGEPTRALLFNTREAARSWCRATMAEWHSRTDGALADWRVREVPVREVVREARPKRARKGQRA